MAPEERIVRDLLTELWHALRPRREEYPTERELLAANRRLRRALGEARPECSRATRREIDQALTPSP